MVWEWKQCNAGANGDGTDQCRWMSVGPVGAESWTVGLFVVADAGARAVFCSLTTSEWVEYGPSPILKSLARHGLVRWLVWLFVSVSACLSAVWVGSVCKHTAAGGLRCSQKRAGTARQRMHGSWRLARDGKGNLGMGWQVGVLACVRVRLSESVCERA